MICLFLLYTFFIYAPFIFQDQYNISVFHYGLIASLVSLFGIIGAWLNVYLLKTRRPQSCLRTGLFLLSLFILIFTLTSTLSNNLYLITAILLCTVLTTSFILPIYVSDSLTSYRYNYGFACGVYGLTIFGGVSLLSIGAIALHINHFYKLSILYIAMVVTLLIYTRLKIRE